VQVGPPARGAPEAPRTPPPPLHLGCGPPPPPAPALHPGCPNAFPPPPVQPPVLQIACGRLGPARRDSYHVLVATPAALRDNVKAGDLTGMVTVVRACCVTRNGLAGCMCRQPWGHLPFQCVVLCWGQVLDEADLLLTGPLSDPITSYLIPNLKHRWGVPLAPVTPPLPLVPVLARARPRSSLSPRPHAHQPPRGSWAHRAACAPPPREQCTCSHLPSWGPLPALSHQIRRTPGAVCVLCRHGAGPGQQERAGLRTQALSWRGGCGCGRRPQAPTHVAAGAASTCATSHPNSTPAPPPPACVGRDAPSPSSWRAVCVRV
jgi:hypothetical protein